MADEEPTEAPAEAEPEPSTEVEVARPFAPAPPPPLTGPRPDPPTGEERAILRSIGVPDPQPENPLHRDVLDIVRRMRNAPVGTRNVALSYAWLAELDRQGRAHAIAKSRYERLLAREIIRLRQTGIEKSGTAAEKRAEDNDDVWQAHLDYRLAERLEWVAKSALRVLEVANDNWRTQQANERAADSAHARSGV
jgi:hypothetical protein